MTDQTDNQGADEIDHEHLRDPRPGREASRRHRRQRRAGAADRHQARLGRGRPGAAGPQPAQGRGRGGAHPRRGAAARVTTVDLDLASLESVRALGDESPRRRPAGRHPDQQRRSHDPADPPRDRGRVRAAVRHQLPGPLRADRPRPPAPARGIRAGDDAVRPRRPLSLLPVDDLQYRGKYAP